MALADRDLVGVQVTVTPDQVTACLVTRGDTDMQPILDTLPYDRVIVWNNSEREDLKTFGRYGAMFEAHTEVVYFQDDDTIFRHHDELMAAYDPCKTTAVYGHGQSEAGFGDLALVCGGALAHTSQVARAVGYYAARFPLDKDFLYDCDFAIGVLTPFKHVDLPFEIRDLAYNGRRLADEPWQRETKLRVTNRARWIRDHVLGPSQTVSEPVAA